MISTTLDKRSVRKVLIVITWLIIWQLLSVLINNSILIAGPIETIIALYSMAGTASFWLSLLNSALRIIGGFCLGSIIGMLLAMLSYKVSFFEEFIAPFVSVIKTIPVASFVIIVLIWVGAPNLSLIISSFVVFPIIYLSTLEGLKNIDIKMLEVASTYKIKPYLKFKHIYIASLKPFLISSMSLAAGMSYKSGIAAEVIGRPKMSMGTGLYNSKVYLDTPSLFAWTLMAILLAYIFERGIKYLLRRYLANES